MFYASARQRRCATLHAVRLSAVSPDQASPQRVRLREPSGRWLVAAAVLGSSLAMVDATVVNIALPALGNDLHAEFDGLQWTITGYTLTLASFILLGGSLGDRYGRRRVFVLGTVWFAVASALCALAPNIEVLVAARALQGVGGALLTPGSLAIIDASFAEEDRGKAIGAWSGFGGIASAIGPFIGGYLVAGPGWRWVFLINLPLALLVVVIARRHVPESRDPRAVPHLDVLGAVLWAVGLGGETYALLARTALLPVTAIMLVLSARAGALAGQIGPRLPMTLGPIVAAVGLLLLLRIGPGASYVSDVLPAVIVFGVGLSLLVAPLTATVLGAAEAQHSGIASGINNAVARA